MTDDSNIGTMLAVAGLFAITFYLLRDPVGDAESAIIAAASCTGLTGATLAACQKAKAPAPKPQGIIAAKPKPQGITAARPRGITAARPSVSTPRTRARSTGGGVGGPTQKALECKRRGGIWQAYANRGTNGTAFRCLMPIQPSQNTSLRLPHYPVGGYSGRPVDRQCIHLGGKWIGGQCIFNNRAITPTDLRNLANKKCIDYANSIVNPLRLQAEKNLMAEVGAKTFEELVDPLKHPSGDYRVSLYTKKYDEMFTVLRTKCINQAGYSSQPASRNIISGYNPKVPFEHAT